MYVIYKSNYLNAYNTVTCYNVHVYWMTKLYAYMYITTITYKLNDHFARNKNLLTITAMNRWTICGDIYDQILASTDEIHLWWNLQACLCIECVNCTIVQLFGRVGDGSISSLHPYCISPSNKYLLSVLSLSLSPCFLFFLFLTWRWLGRCGHNCFVCNNGGGVLHVCSQLFCLWSQFLYKSVKIVFIHVYCVHIYDRSTTCRTMYPLYML